MQEKGCYGKTDAVLSKSHAYEQGHLALHTLTLNRIEKRPFLFHYSISYFICVLQWYIKYRTFLSKN